MARAVSSKEWLQAEGLTLPRAGRFPGDLVEILLVFFAVAALDLTMGSLLTGKLRLWFPQWVDPLWQARPDSPVTYSQSYLAGVCLIPILAGAVDRAFLAGRRRLRLGLWVSCAAVFGFLAWWKGGLMLQHGKEREAAAWFVATLLVWAIVRLSQEMPARVGAMEPRRLLRGFLLGLSAFFLGMSVLDPLIQVGVHGLAWSEGLLIEVGFFIPAGLVMLGLARREAA